MYVEVHGWNKENEVVEASGHTIGSETEDDVIERIVIAWRIVEIGECIVSR